MIGSLLFCAFAVVWTIMAIDTFSYPHERDEDDRSN